MIKNIGNSIPKFYKPSELTSAKYERLVGSIVPIFDSKFSLQLCSEPSIKDLVTWSIGQLKLITNSMHESFTSVMQIESFFHSFFVLIVEYAGNSREAMFQKKSTYLKQTLPEKWIYDKESRQVFSPHKFAFEVKNQIAPEILKFPPAYSDSIPNLKLLLSQMGVEPFFSIRSLLSKLAAIREQFGSKPVDAKTIEICQNVVLELIYVSESRLDISLSLEELREATEGFYLPDNLRIMRNVINLCNGKLNERFSSKKEIYSLHPSIFGAEKFGIEDSKIVFSRLIGKPFGQKELLINRIKGILQNYSNEICLFTELIQNADDAEAKEIRFVLDRRQLPT